MSNPTPYPKKIDVLEKVFYHFKVSPSCYALFDSEINTPVIYGSYNLVSSTIKNLPPTVSIFYFETDPRMGWKMKRTYKPDNKTVSTKDKKNSVESAKENK